MNKRYTCAEVAELYRVSVLTVRDWIKTGKLDARKIGRRYLINETDLAAFEQQPYPQTTEEEEP